MIILRVDDVGRCPQDTPELGTDGNLGYFEEWRKAAGLLGAPVIYGVVPKWLTERGADWLRKNLGGDEVLAVHGFDHKMNATVSLEEMQYGMNLLKCESYIPPYNKYDDTTLSDWEVVGGKYLFGGRNFEHHLYGDKPVIMGGVVHIPACWNLYGRAGELTKAVKEMTKPSFPVVATLHVPWDRNFQLVKDFVDAVSPYLITLQELDTWLGENHGN